MKEKLMKAVQFWLEQNEATQEKLADRAKVSQATVSRAATGNWNKLTPKLKALCRFFDIEVVERDPRNCDQLMKVIGEMWDGTTAGEESLVRLLRSIQAYRL
ncbi:hypothetical protein [Gynuella sp.]|uniref:hypothetical protein n=1 Tax=Gynuella sp. TaxID=2969146 RepID=UPI003D136C61